MISKSLTGLLILGTETGCGKTVVTTGLAGALQQEGFNLRTIKPIHRGSRAQAQGELTFISTIARTPLTYPIQYLEGPALLSAYQWSQGIRTCLTGVDPTLVELPGGCATPLSEAGANGNGWRDSADFATELGWPCLLVARQSADCLEKLLTNCIYLSCRGSSVIGFVIVACSQESSSINSIDFSKSAPEMLLQEKLGVPFFGYVPFSPSIDVNSVNQGNLIKTISSSLDLLPIIKALNLRISV